MTYFNAIVLGLVQGLTEFLPVSSSGHLLIFQNFFGMNADSILLFTILMHLGTLISVFVCFWQDIVLLCKELVFTILDLVKGRGLRLAENPVRKLGIMIIVASIPTAVIGILFEDLFKNFYATLLPTGVGLIITACLLWIAERKENNVIEIGEMKFFHAILIGIMQGIAICPGISRSGSTLVGGLFAGLKREFALEFAFLISIPSILGSLIFEMDASAFNEVISIQKGPIILGAVIAAVSGILAIKSMLTVVRKYSLRYFSLYTWCLGLYLIIYTLKR